MFIGHQPRAHLDKKHPKYSNNENAKTWIDVVLKQSNGSVTDVTYEQKKSCLRPGPVAGGTGSDEAGNIGCNSDSDLFSR